MNWKEIGLKVAGFGLPVIGTILGGPAGGTIGTLIASKLGVEATPEAVAEAIEKDPEIKLKLLALQNDHEQEMGKLYLEAKNIERLADKDYLEDRASARDRDVAMRQAGQANKRADYMIIGDVLGLITCVIVLAILFFQGSGDPPVGITTVLTTFATYFGLGLRDAHSFEFGSSRGSKEKGEALQEMAYAAPPIKPLQGGFARPGLLAALALLALLLPALCFACSPGCSEPLERTMLVCETVQVQECLGGDGSSALYFSPWLMPKEELTGDEVIELGRVITASREMLHQLRVKLVATLGEPTPEEIEELQNLFYQLDAVLDEAPALLSKPFAK
jgi:hypothetical protein